MKKYNGIYLEYLLLCIVSAIHLIIITIITYFDYMDMCFAVINLVWVILLVIDGYVKNFSNVIMRILSILWKIMYFFFAYNGHMKVRLIKYGYKEPTFLTMFFSDLLS